MHIAVVDPDYELQKSLSDYLAKEDYRVSSLLTFDEVETWLSKGDVDLVIIDPHTFGEDAFLKIRKFYHYFKIPIIIISYLAEEKNRIYGLECGAEDYLSKPISFREISLKIKKISSRSAVVKEKLYDMVFCDENKNELTINNKKNFLSLNKTEFYLTATQWRILLYMVKSGGLIVTRDQIIDNCMSFPYTGYDRTIDAHIKNLRKAISKGTWITTVRGAGYKFNGVEVFKDS